jgi:GT2 family glycosyltransferase
MPNSVDPGKAPAREPSLAVVILHYGPAERTRALHRQLLDADPDWSERIRVLDNAAPEPYPGAWLRTEENRYWAGAFGLALDRCAAEGFSHLWFLNNDLRFDGPAPYVARAWGRLAHMAKSLGRVGVYTPSVLASPYHPQMVRREGSQQRLVPYVDGIAPLVDVDCVRAAGGLDCEGNAYGYGVDVWLSLRVGRAGFGVVVDDQVSVRHKYHSTAREVDGFLSRAAQAEDAYLRARLGDDWREALAALRAGA